MEQVKTVQAIQDYIRRHFQEEGFCAERVCMAAGYSRRHAERYGFRYAYDAAPAFNFGADTVTGAKVAVPAVRTTGK